MTTRRTALRAIAAVGTLAAFDAFSATPATTVPTQPAGSGTELDPYVITTVQELQWMATDIPSFGTYYVLANDIDASATADWNGGAGFLPIGSSPGFGGFFDGQGYTISERTINRPTQSSVGLFGFAFSAVIESVHLTDVDVTGNFDVGGLVGMNDGTVCGSTARGSVSGDTGVGDVVGDGNVAEETCS